MSVAQILCLGLGAVLGVYLLIGLGHGAFLIAVMKRNKVNSAPILRWESLWLVVASALFWPIFKGLPDHDLPGSLP